MSAGRWLADADARVCSVMVETVPGPVAMDGLLAATRTHHADLPAYLNFVEGEERRSAVTDAFDPVTRARLAEVKQRVDPRGLFGYGVPLG